MIVLALSKGFYINFDQKSKQFIEEALDLIDKKFTGSESINLQRYAAESQALHEFGTSQQTRPVVRTQGNPVEDFTLEYYSQIETTKKAYRKTLKKNASRRDKAVLRDSEFEEVSSQFIDDELQMPDSDPETNPED